MFFVLLGKICSTASLPEVFIHKRKKNFIVKSKHRPVDLSELMYISKTKVKVSTPAFRFQYIGKQEILSSTLY